MSSRWRMVAVAFVCHFIAVGFFFYSYGVFFKALAHELSASRFQVSLGLAAASVAAALSAPFVGRLIEGGRIKLVMIVGAMLMATGFVVASRATAFWQLLIAFSLLVGVGMVALGGLSPSVLVTGWFEEKRGTALGIASMGISLSGLIMPAAATWLIGRFGWRSTFMIYAAATVLIVIPPVALLVTEPPPRHPSEEEEPLWSTTELLHHRAFWSLVVVFGATISAVGAILTHFVPLLTDAGLSSYRAASLLSTAAAFGVAGKIVFGAIADRTDPRWAMWLSQAFQLAGVLVLMQAKSTRQLIAAAVVFGFGMGGVVPLQNLLVSRTFGARAYARTFGLMRPFMLPLTAAGIPAAGWLFDRYGSYDVALRTFALAYLVSAVTLLTVPRLSREESPQSS